MDLKIWTILLECWRIWFSKERKGSKVKNMLVMMPCSSIKKEEPGVAYDKETVPVNPLFFQCLSMLFMCKNRLANVEVQLF